MKVTADDDNRLPPGRTPRVLVVDDEESLRELLELTLVGMGLDVDVAEDLSTARALLERYRYSLCLTDMRLPDGNGLDILDAMRAEPRLRDVPVMVISAVADDRLFEDAKSRGASACLSKPVDLQEVRQVALGLLYSGY